MEDRNNKVPNVMPDVMVEPITDMELIVAKLKHEGKINKQSLGNPHFENFEKEV